MVKNWYKRTPENFRFTAKFPKVITHDKRLSDFDGNQLNYFFESISSHAHWDNKDKEDDDDYFVSELNN